MADKEDDGLDVQQLKDKYGGFWSEHPLHSEREWKLQVENEDTRLGYWEWVHACIVNGD